jgi:hypothetical protein
VGLNSSVLAGVSESGGGGGSGTVSDITSTAGTIAVTNPTGPTVNVDLAQQGATSGQVLAWNGTQYAPTSAATGTVSDITSTSGTAVITNPTGPTVNVERAAITGDVAIPAASNTATLATITTATGPIGSTTAVPVVTIDAKGRVTALTSTAIITGVSSVTNSDGTITVVTTSGAAVVSRPAITGDISIPTGSNAATLATVNSNTGSFGSTSVVPVITVNGKGLITAVSTATITPASIGAVPQTTPQAGSLASDYPVTTTLATFLTTASLGVGTWLIHFQGVVETTSASAVAVEGGINLGTATATFSGSESFATAMPSSVDSDGTAIGLSCLAVITVAGTLVFQAKGSASTTIKASTPVNSYANATGYTATRVA